MSNAAGQSVELEPNDPGEAGRRRKKPRAALRWCLRLTFVILILLIVAAVVIPGYCDYSVRAKAQEGVNLANPLRTSVASACRDGTLHESMTHDELGLDPPSAYSGRYTHSARVEGVDASTSRVVVVMKGFARDTKSPVREGDTIVYTGRCADGQVRWSVDGTIADKYKPRV